MENIFVLHLLENLPLIEILESLEAALFACDLGLIEVSEELDDGTEQGLGVTQWDQQLFAVVFPDSHQPRLLITTQETPIAEASTRKRGKPSQCYSNTKTFISA